MFTLSSQRLMQLNWRNTSEHYNHILWYLAIDNKAQNAKFTIRNHLPEHLTSWIFFFQRYNSDQKSMPDSVGICLIFSWHNEAQEQPNIKHITQLLASQSLSSRLEKPVDKRYNAIRINKGVTQKNTGNIIQSSVCFRLNTDHRWHHVEYNKSNIMNLQNQSNTRGIWWRPWGRESQTGIRDPGRNTYECLLASGKMIGNKGARKGEANFNITHKYR